MGSGINTTPQSTTTCSKSYRWSAYTLMWFLIPSYRKMVVPDQRGQRWLGAEIGDMEGRSQTSYPAHRPLYRICPVQPTWSQKGSQKGDPEVNRCSRQNRYSGLWCRLTSRSPSRGKRASTLQFGRRARSDVIWASPILARATQTLGVSEGGKSDSAGESKSYPQVKQ